MHHLSHCESLYCAEDTDAKLKGRTYVSLRIFPQEKYLMCSPHTRTHTHTHKGTRTHTLHTHPPTPPHTPPHTHVDSLTFSLARLDLMHTRRTRMGRRRKSSGDLMRSNWPPLA